MTKKILTFFTDSGTPQTGLSPIIRIRDLSDNSLVVTDASMTEVGDGYYSYDFTDYDEDEGYSIRCDGGAGLGDTDRYTYAGNESYVDDIWDAQIADHQVIGSLASEIRASHGETVSGGGSIDRNQAEAIAKMVWQVILNNDETARDVLLSRSDFDALKDKVLLKDKIEIPEAADHTEILKGIAGLDESLKAIRGMIPESTNKEMAAINKSLVNVAVKMEAISKNMMNVGSDNNKNSKEVNKMISEFTSAASQFRDSLEENISTVNSRMSEMSDSLDVQALQEFTGNVKLFKESVTTMLALAEKMGNLGPQTQALKTALVQMTNLKFDLQERRIGK